MTSITLQNGQTALYQRRPKPSTTPIGNIVQEFLANMGKGGEVETPELPKRYGRSFKVTPLGEFKYDHLNTEDAERLRRAVNKTSKWIEQYQQEPGLAMVLTGSVGTGKTTLAQNLLNCFKQRMVPLDRDSHPITELGVEILDGRLIHARDLMALLSGDYTDDYGVQHRAAPNLRQMFWGVKVIVIDDLGKEEIPFTNAQTFTEKRQNRYAHLFDYVYRSLENGERKHIIITSNIPLIVEATGQKAKAWNPDFVDVIGEAAWSRLKVMADGFMADLTGLPDYRPYQLRDELADI